MPFKLTVETFRILPETMTIYAWGEGGGEEPGKEMGWDARRLAYGCKFRILVSLRVFWAKRHRI